MEEQKQQQQPKHEEISELKVLRSAAGYYVGRQQYDQDMDAWIPHNRISLYMKKQAEAEKTLEKALEFKKEIKPISRGNLRVIRNNFNDPSVDDPDKELKKNVISDQLQNDQEKKQQLQKQLQKELSR